MEEAPETISEPAAWALPQRLAFRFAFCYWLLYCLPERGRVSLIDAIPGGDIKSWG